MAGMHTGNSELLIRSELYSSMLKQTLTDETMYGQGHVNWLSEFPDGETFTIPSIGELDAYDYSEDQPVDYTALDTGEFQFSINKYKATATYMTDKNKQDSFYSSMLESQFVPQQAAAIRRHLERDILKEGQPLTGNPAGYQVAGSLNSINGEPHRWVASDTFGGGSARVLGVEDFSRASLALKKANVPLNKRVAIVSPSTAHALETQANLTNFISTPRWEGLVTEGLSTGMQFKYNVFGFDVYESNFLPKCGADQTGTSETIDSVASGANAVCNLFFSADAMVKPFIGAWRQMPRVEITRNADFQRDQYITTARYGVKIYRPENLVTVLSADTLYT